MKRNRCIVVMTAIGLLALATPGLAQLTALGDELHLSGPSAGRTHEPAATFSPAGGVRLLWSSASQGILGRAANAAGRPSGPPVSLAANDLPDALPFDGQVRVRKAPAVVALRNGDFLAFWTDELVHLTTDIFYEHRDLLASHVHGQRFDRSGRPVGRAFAVSGIDVGPESAAQAVILASGRVLVAWQVDTGEAAGVYARLLRPRGSGVGPAFRVDAGASGPGADAAVAAAEDGGFLVAWKSCCGTSGDPLVLARRFAPDGSAAGDAFAVSVSSSRGQYLPAVARGANGEFVVAWMGATDDETGSRYRIYGRLVSAAGDPIGSDVALSTGSDRADSAPAVAVAPDGYVVAWTVWDRTFPYAIFAAPVDASLAPTGPVIPVNTGVINFQWELALTGDGQGRYLLAWEGFDSSGHLAIEGRILSSEDTAAGQLTAAPMAVGQ